MQVPQQLRSVWFISRFQFHGCPWNYVSHEISEKNNYKNYIIWVFSFDLIFCMELCRDLHNNSLEGDIPDYLGTMPNLKQLCVLFLSFTTWSTTVLTSISQLSLTFPTFVEIWQIMISVGLYLHQYQTIKT